MTHEAYCGDCGCTRTFVLKMNYAVLHTDNRIFIPMYCGCNKLLHLALDKHNYRKLCKIHNLKPIAIGN